MGLYVLVSEFRKDVLGGYGGSAIQGLTNAYKKVCIGKNTKGQRRLLE